VGEVTGSLKRETILYAVAASISGLVVLAFLPFISRSLSAGQAGEVGSLRTLADIVAGIAVLGLPSGILRFWQDGVTSRRAILGRAVAFPAMTALVLGAVLYAFRDPVSSLLRLSSPSVLVHGFLLGVGAALVQVFLTPHRAEGRSWTYLVIQAVRGAASIALLAMLLASAVPRVPAFLLSRWAPALACAVVALALAIPLAKGGTGKPSSLMKYSLPLVPAGLALLVLSSADMIMLRAMCDDAGQSGYYEWALSACMALTPFTLGFGMAWQRHIFRIREERGSLAELGRSALQFAVLTLWAAALLSLASPELASMVGGETYLPAAKVIPLLAGANAVYALYLVSQTGPMLSGQTGWIAIATILGAVANILFNARLIPLYGAAGAALATLGTNIFMSASLFWTGRRSFPVSFPVILILMLVATMLMPMSKLPGLARLLSAVAWSGASLGLILLLGRKG
jgi:O-antigen/teichoic acid export membrane protein